MATTFLIVFTLAITIVNSVFLWWIFRHVHGMTHTLQKRLMEINLERELTDIFSHDVIDSQDVHKLAFTLFKRVKQQYNVKAQSYTEIANALRARGDIDKGLRDALVDFFENIIHISYREKSLGETERQDIKKKLKMIIGMLPPE